MPALKIFLSCVSGQFQECRHALASDLRAVGFEVKVQEDFQQHGHTLLDKLQQYIAGCDRVIALVGDAYGFEPDPAGLPAGTPRRSYTQWEYFFATGERLDGSRQPRKDLFVYFASPDYLRDNPVRQTPETARLQQDFLALLERSGKDRSTFGSLHELRALVLRDGFPIPERRPAKPISLPYPSLGTLFKGREEFLARLRDSLKRAVDGQATAIVGKALHGLGGVGKTRLAVEYAWRNRDDYSALLFVAAETPQDLRRNLAALAGPLVLDLPENEAPEEEVRLAAALRWLAEHPGWFLIVDNLDTPEAAAGAEEMLARLHGGQVLLTGRLTQWSGCVEPLELDVLGAGDAAAFLLERTQRGRRKATTDAADAAELAGELDGLALALEQAGAYIAQRRLSLAEYLRDWRAHVPAVQEWHNAQLMKYPRSVAVTWQTTMGQLGTGELALLRLLAWLAPEPVPQWALEGGKAEAVWRKAVALLGQELSGLGASSGDVRDALAVSANYSMVRWDVDEETVAVHRVVQEIVRTRLPEDTRKAWLTLSLRLLDGARPHDPMDVRSWPRWNLLRPHVAVAAAQADAAGIAEPTAGLMDQLGLLLCAKALYTEAEPLMRRALAIGERSLGPDHPRVATHLNNLAQLLRATNRLGEAEPLMRRALAIAERSPGPDHASVATHLNNLARLLADTNRLGEAEPLYRRALAIDECSYGPDHPNVAIRVNNLAGLLRATNRLAEAEPLYRRALAIGERSLGPDHPRVATHLNNLAQLLQATGRLGEAEPLMRRALAIAERAFGPDHPNVAIRLNNLALLLRATNRLAEAEPLYRRALAIDERSVGPDHPEVAICLSNLALLLKATNRLAEAEPLSQRAVAIFVEFTRRTGHEHPHLRVALANHRHILKALGHSDPDIQTQLDRLKAEKP
jgi:tetratricopeptide (TPR) repeat protein